MAQMYAEPKEQHTSAWATIRFRGNGREAVMRRHKPAETDLVRLPNHKISHFVFDPKFLRIDRSGNFQPQISLLRQESTEFLEICQGKIQKREPYQIETIAMASYHIFPPAALIKNLKRKANQLGFQLIGEAAA